MALPASFIRDGFEPASAVRKRRHLPGLNRPGIMIGSEGKTNTGKSEFAMSAPGPGIFICVDRGFDGVLDNPNPPASRCNVYAFKVIQAPLSTQAQQADYLAYWKQFYAEYLKALANPDCRVVILDGDSDTWELQRLAEFGKLTQIPSLMYVNVNAARRAMIARAWDSGKIVIATNKVEDEYAEVLGPDGKPLMDNQGKPKKSKTGKDLRQGYKDTDYLWQIQLRHLYKPARINTINGKEIPQQWGIEILKCKPNPQLQGTELWGSDCCFAGLVQTI